MMEMRFWEDSSLQSRVKYESNSNDNIPSRSREAFYCEAANLNFATAEEECVDYAYRTHKSQVRVSRQDPMSHRIIEKRRRDRMNNCLADLSRLIPTEYLKKDRGRVEKTEIIEMAIKHMKHLQYLNHYRLGYQECMSETMRFMVEVEGHYPHEPMCVKLLGHLQKHCENICRESTECSSKAAKQPSAGIALADQCEVNFEANNNYQHINGLIHDADQSVHETDKHEFHEGPGTPPEQLANGYKYKNDIKLRFTQAQGSAKKPKLIDRRTSTPTSIDNQTCYGSPNPLQHVDAGANSLGVSNIQELDRVSMQPSWPCGDSFPPNANVNQPASLNSLQRMAVPIKDQQGAIISPQATNAPNQASKLNFHVPAFVLHAKGSFYVPITLDYQTLLPHLGLQDILHSHQQEVVLHPIAINVNFHHTRYVQPLHLHTTGMVKNELSKFMN